MEIFANGTAQPAGTTSFQEVIIDKVSARNSFDQHQGHAGSRQVAACYLKSLADVVPTQSESALYLDQTVQPGFWKFYSA